MRNQLYAPESGCEWRQTAEDYSVLDNGYLKLIESWGSDQGIIETARMSTNKGFLGWDPGPCPTCDLAYDPKPDCLYCAGKGVIPGDAKLLRYLYEHKHSTPFEFAGLTIEIQAPLMVYREWHRHRTQSYAEMSARYVVMPNLHYVPSIGRIIDSSLKSANKQASGGGVLKVPDANGLSQTQIAFLIQEKIRGEQQSIYQTYEELLRWGVSKEVARLDTPVSRYSRMRATGNLRNWLAFLTLRLDPAAQFEIRQFAQVVADLISHLYPRTWALALDAMAPKKIFTPEHVRKLQAVADALAFAKNDFAERGVSFPMEFYHAEDGVGELIKELSP